MNTMFALLIVTKFGIATAGHFPSEGSCIEAGERVYVSEPVEVAFICVPVWTPLNLFGN